MFVFVGRAMNLMTEMFGSQNVRWCTELDTDIIVITVDTSKAVLNARTMVRNRLLSFTIFSISTCLYCYSMYQSRLVFVITQEAAKKIVTQEVPLHNLFCLIPIQNGRISSGRALPCELNNGSTNFLQPVITNLIVKTTLVKQNWF